MFWASIKKFYKKTRKKYMELNERFDFNQTDFVGVYESCNTDNVYHYTEGNSIQLFGSISHLQLNNYVNANTMILKTLMRS